MPPLKNNRAFELDALRGLALLMMILHHFIFDLRYLLDLDVFAFQETWWFENLLRPVFLNVFLLISGICCTFSRSNTRRGLRLLLVACGFTAATVIASRISGIDLYIFFNVLHLLALGTLLYAAVTWPERRSAQSAANETRKAWLDVLLLLLAAVMLWLASLLPHWAAAGNYWLLPLGLPPVKMVAMGDYLPIIPWLGFFIIGALIGRRAYSTRQSAFPGAPGWLLQVSRPFEWFGRHSLGVYALHQPVLLAVLYALRGFGLI